MIIIVCLIQGCSHENLTYYRNGELQSKIRYDSQGHIVESLIYYRSGHLKSRQQWTDDHSGTGVVTLYFQNGTVKEITNWIYGLLHGEFRQYFDDGKIKLSQPYENGCGVGPGKIFTRNGNIAELAISDNKCRLYFFSKWNEDGERELQFFLPLFSVVNKIDSIELTFETPIKFYGEGFVTLGTVTGGAFKPIGKRIKLIQGRGSITLPLTRVDDLEFRFDFAPSSQDTLNSIGIQKRILSRPDSIIRFENYKGRLQPDDDSTPISKLAGSW